MLSLMQNRIFVLQTLQDAVGQTQLPENVSNGFVQWLTNLIPAFMVIAEQYPLLFLVWFGVFIAVFVLIKGGVVGGIVAAIVATLAFGFIASLILPFLPPV